MSPEDLRIVLRVAELGSFTEAAQRLGLPRATVSTAVRRLEERLGARLLQRTTRRVSLTDDGRLFVERCQDVLADLDELRTMFQQQPQALTGRLRVDMPLAMARALVLPRLPEFLALHPGLAVEIGAADRRVDPVREGYDAVIRVGAVVAEQLVGRPLGAYTMVNVASPGYVARHGEPRSVEDLAAHRLVHYQPNLGDRPAGFEYLAADGSLRSVTMAGVVTVNATDAYLAACEAGLGIIQIPEASARPGLEAGRLVALLPAFVPPPMPVTLLLPHRRHLPRRVRAFADWVATLFPAPR
ncbi:LysR family transcriptional regulator [Rubrivivax benzoatilyticus]|uniref:LysR family transcriptional regulator n=1 Tax=Rubrivivax benzoatilyticus TaxID=316997 RepID=A0ABX0HXJ9_9BURK|nr:LysR family transcriptional regulator [Rubrivivax benzoatilyticus]EGJ11261.1 transcriptional regulator [Rubrivivax benzoatilyticus JA2 = ATCC BAA-35]MCD0422270.1 LysR family transcriptional regulator [Rubrivivax sp. JA1024]NHK99727.1 LysR family transcriptional regulator [Rubrivivax benzoatilyticus]NHL25600.1 LysR family transcriptional regulator [Rubrivivax benzoatilyticus]